MPQTAQQPDVSEKSTPDPQETPIVYFDGVCGLCNGTVNFLMQRDRRGVLRFAPLQGQTARSNLSEQHRDLNSIVFQHGERSWRHSAAIVRILWTLGGVWAVLGGCLWVIPKPIRDLGYLMIAKLRYRFFGKQETCRMPRPEERGRVLD